MQRLPPLNSLRAFEAAARHLNFSKAAAELNVTPAAISHQIKGLEEYVGVPLFRRLRHGLMLTDEAQAMLPGIRKGFAGFAEAMAGLASFGQAGYLTVHVQPSVAVKWLVPRLEHFSRAYPDISVRIAASIELVDFAREGIDIGLQFGDGNYPGLVAEVLMHGAIAPMCSPRLLEGPRPLRRPEDLRYFTLLHDESEFDAVACSWSRWLQAAGVSGIDVSRGLHFNTSGDVLSAAVEGTGVAIGKVALAADDLKAGRLVCLFDAVAPTPFGYYVLYAEGGLARPKVAAFRDWLFQEAANHG